VISLISRIVAVFQPVDWVGFDVEMNSTPFVFVADDAVVESALPYFFGGEFVSFVDVFCYARFELTNYCAQRFWERVFGV